MLLAVSWSLCVKLIPLVISFLTVSSQEHKVSALTNHRQEHWSVDMASVIMLASFWTMGNCYLLSALSAEIGLLSWVCISWETREKLFGYMHQFSLPQHSLFIRSNWQSDVSIRLLLPINPWVSALFPHYILTPNKPRQSLVVRGLRPHFSKVFCSFSPYMG